MSRSKQKGTRWETAIVEYLRTNGVSHAERRTFAGAHDKGDISGIPGIVIEAKNEKAISLAAYADEAATEATNAGAALGVAWIHRRGKASPAAGYVLMSGADLIHLLEQAGYIPNRPQRRPDDHRDVRP